jgi:hypothetical protein
MLFEIDILLHLNREKIWDVHKDGMGSDRMIEVCGLGLGLGLGWDGMGWDGETGKSKSHHLDAKFSKDGLLPFRTAFNPRPRLTILLQELKDQI